ncbi:sensor histidine kinase YesM [Paenibacillus albidus]|uniref:Sensor histidine kinase YesM n=2 Tax=Paenibacillus albidus TaxID=2041023 RepID=A0A917FDR2_9BACL|nr:sensor histidine kinase YesM [Paenibacillus albidus]
MNMNLRRKLFAVFFVASILPLSLLIYFSYTSIRNELRDQSYETMISTTAQINANLQNKLDYYVKISNSLFLDGTLRGYLTHTYNDNRLYLEAYTYFDNLLSSVRISNPDISGITIYTDNHSLPKDNVLIKALDETADKEGFFKALEGTYGNAVFLTQSSGNKQAPTLRLARLLNNYSLNYPYGILSMDIAESDIYSLIAEEDENKSIYIVNSEGNILSSKDKSVLGSPLQELLPDPFPEEGSGKFDSIYKGEQVLVVYDTLNYGWKTVTIVPYNNFAALAKAAAARLMPVALICLLLAVFLIYITAGLFTRRVIALLKMIRRAEREEFTDAPQEMGNDEIGQLSQAFHSMSGRISSLINEVYKKEIAKQEIEMNVLQAQINPHFLYNTLASISSLAIKYEDARIHRMVTDLAKFYRISLNKGKHIISINEEITLTKHYMAIQQTRFAGLLNMHYQIEDNLLPKRIVKLTLQPFVENCINHAIWDDEARLNIIIRGYPDGEDLVLEVIDDGMGMSAGKTAHILEQGNSGGEHSSGYGIANVNRRLKLLFGEGYGVQIFSALGIGTQVSIRIPGSGIPRE